MSSLPVRDNSKKMFQYSFLVGGISILLAACYFWPIVSISTSVDYDRIIADQTAAIAKYGYRCDYYRKRADAHLSKGNYAAVIDDYNTLITTETENEIEEKAEMDKRLPFLRTTISPSKLTAEDYATRAFALHKQKRWSYAIENYEYAITKAPAYAWANNELASIYSSCPSSDYHKGGRAVVLASVACSETSWKVPSYIDTLAASYARTGNYATAVTFQQKAIAIAPATKLEDYRSRLKLYQSEKAYAEP